MEIFGVGLPELLLIGVVALIVLGPERLPEAARTLGKGVADLRRAIEPARSAWTDLTNEVTSVTGSITSVATSATIKSRPGGKTTAIPTENPWTIHPIMADMTAEEREAFMAGGQMPPRLIDQLSRNGAAGAQYGRVAADTELDYPMPHSEITYQPAPPFSPRIEDLDYPEPDSNTREEQHHEQDT